MQRARSRRTRRKTTRPKTTNPRTMPLPRKSPRRRKKRRTTRRTEARMRIVSLLSSATEILFGIGAGDDVVAVSHECDYPSEATKLPRATRSIVDSSRPSHEIDEQVKRLLSAGEALYEIDRDLIRQLQPDLIVTQAQCDVCAVRYQDVVEFVAADPSLVQAQIVALNPQSVENILDDVVSVGRAAGCA